MVKIALSSLFCLLNFFFKSTLKAKCLGFVHINRSYKQEIERTQRILLIPPYTKGVIFFGTGFKKLCSFQPLPFSTSTKEQTIHCV